MRGPFLALVGALPFWAVSAGASLAVTFPPECGVFAPDDLPPRDTSLTSGIEVFERVCLSDVPPSRERALTAMGGETFEEPGMSVRSPHVIEAGDEVTTIFRGDRIEKSLDDLIVQFGTGTTLGAEVRHCSVLAIGSTFGETVEGMKSHTKDGWVLVNESPPPFSIIPKPGLAWWIDAPHNERGFTVLSLMGDPAKPDCPAVGLSLEIMDGPALIAGFIREYTDPERIAERAEWAERRDALEKFLAE